MESMEKWVQEVFAPVVLTCSTPEAERVAQKNNLSFADLLNGFATLNDVDTPLRSVSHQIRLGSFNYRFLAAGQFGTAPIADATRQLNESVARHPPHGAPVVDLHIPRVESVDDVPVYLRAIGAESDKSEPFSWYREFKLTLMDTFRCEEYGQMNHPSAMLIVVSSTEANPRQSFEELGAPQNLPPVFIQGLYDASLVPKYYVVVHDVGETEGTGIDPDAILRGIGIPESNGAVLRINSKTTATTLAVDSVPVPTVWSSHPYVRPPLFPGSVGAFQSNAMDGYGGMLTDNDVAHVKAFVIDFGLHFVLPAMEARLFQLNEIVSAMKKGVKNVFKSWLRKPKDLSRPASSVSGGASGNAITYRYDSIEAQTRLLADTAFLMRDYDLALQTYRLARDDFKSDKSIFHCANTNEMIALCLLLTRGSPMQITNALDAANSAYAKVNTLVASRFAVRTAVIAGEIYNTLSHLGLFTDYMDNASAALIRGSTMEQGICSAVLMERAALCDLHARQPKFRKYGFRMVMAGHVYDSLGHGPHSARCYSLARAIYDCSGWFQVEDHINFTLAQQANRLNDPMASVNLFLKLIGTGRNSASQQEALLYEFGLIVKEILLTTSSSSGSTKSGVVSVFEDETGANKLLVKDLCMPELEDKSTVVFAPVNAVGIDRAIDGNEADADTWKDLEDLVDQQNRLHQYATSEGNAPEGVSSKWFAPSHFYTMSFRNKRNALKKPANYALGEPIYVEFVMKNALSCAVDVENIRLYGHFEPSGTSNGGAFDVPELSRGEDTDASAADRVDVASVNLQLLPVSEERVRLSICPKIPGKLTIVGVRWSICGGDVHGEHAFDIPGPLLQDTRAHKEARARAPNTSLVANVVGPMPWLGVETSCVSTDVFAGEVVQMQATLFNAGSAKLTGLQCSSKALMLCASIPGNDKLVRYIGASGQVVDLSEMTLEPGEKKVLTLWTRVTACGRQQIPLLFQYHGSSADKDGSKPVWTSPSTIKRVVKTKVALNVVPCVDVSYRLEPSLARSGEFILGVSVLNQRTDTQELGVIDQRGFVQLERLLCVSKHWTIEKFTLDDPAVPDAGRLGFQEASTSYFRMMPRPVSLAAYEACSLPLNGSVSDEDLLAKLPLEQFLCLDNALAVVKASAGANADGSDTSADAKPGGLRSIQSVRRENKAKAKQDNQDAAGSKDSVVEAAAQPTVKEALLSSPELDGHLVLVWSAEHSDGRSRSIGQSNFTGIQVRSPVVPRSCPLTVSLSYPDTINLAPTDTAGGLHFAELEFVMDIRNAASIDSPPVDFAVELLHPEECDAVSAAARPISPASDRTNSHVSPRREPFVVPMTGSGRRSSSPHFFWTGVTKKTVVQFAPTAHVAIHLKACFVAPGVYNLNRFRVVLLPSVGEATAGATSTAFAFPADYLVYVNPPRPVASEATHVVDGAANGLATSPQLGEPLVAIP